MYACSRAGNVQGGRMHLHPIKQQWQLLAVCSSASLKRAQASSTGALPLQGENGLFISVLFGQCECACLYVIELFVCVCLHADH